MQQADREPLRDLQRWIADHLGADLSVEALARRAAMSPRNFARVFTREVGMTPGQFVRAIQGPEETARKTPRGIPLDGVVSIASECGFLAHARIKVLTFITTLHVTAERICSRFLRKSVSADEREGETPCRNSRPDFRRPDHARCDRTIRSAVANPGRQR